MTAPLALPAADAVSVTAYLKTRSLIPADPGDVRVTLLTGGVSGRVVLVELGGARRMVLKTARGRLQVQSPWYAKPERAVTEAAAMELLHGLRPGYTPELVDVDATAFTLVMSAAPAAMTSWKTRLLETQFEDASDEGVAAGLGRLLATWHRATWGDATVAGRFADYEGFVQLRIDPFHRSVAVRHPAVADAIEVQELLTDRSCLVHGDFSPKNVLVDGTQLLVLDFEVAHFGAPVFDLAFLHSHLLLKAVHRPTYRTHISRVADAFVHAYHAGAVPVAAFSRLAQQVACLLLARVDGTSPVAYLTEQQQNRVRALALDCLRRDDLTLPKLWQEVTG